MYLLQPLWVVFTLEIHTFWFNDRYGDLAITHLKLKTIIKPVRGMSLQKYVIRIKMNWVYLIQLNITQEFVFHLAVLKRATKIRKADVKN